MKDDNITKSVLIIARIGKDAKVTLIVGVKIDKDCMHNDMTLWNNTLLK